jgi:hypothetical protein
MRKKKIMAMVFAAMMMVASFTATSSEQWSHCSIESIFCPINLEISDEVELETNTVMVCGNTESEWIHQYMEWNDIICN